MLPSIEMEPQDELQQLLPGKRPSSKNSRRRKALQEGPTPPARHPHPSDPPRPGPPLAADRKRRTRRLILIGSYIDSVSQADPEAMTRLRKGLDEFLERDPDRVLFDLAPRPKDA